MGKKYRERVEREKNVGWKTRMQASLLWKIFIFSFKSALAEYASSRLLCKP